MVSEPTTTAKLMEGLGSAWGAKCLVGVKPPARCSSPVRRRIAVPPLDEPPREVGGLGLISRGSAKPEEEEDEEEEGEACAFGSSGGRGAISGGGSGGCGWGTEVRVKARGSTLGEMMRCFVLLHLWVRLPEPAMEKGREITVLHYWLWPLGGRSGPLPPKTKQAWRGSGGTLERRGKGIQKGHKNTTEGVGTRSKAKAGCKRSCWAGPGLLRAADRSRA